MQYEAQNKKLCQEVLDKLTAIANGEAPAGDLYTNYYFYQVVTDGYTPPHMPQASIVGRPINGDYKAVGNTFADLCGWTAILGGAINTATLRLFPHYDTFINAAIMLLDIREQSTSGPLYETLPAFFPLVNTLADTDSDTPPQSAIKILTDLLAGTLIIKTPEDKIAELD